MLQRNIYTPIQKFWVWQMFFFFKEINIEQ